MVDSERKKKIVFTLLGLLILYLVIKTITGISTTIKATGGNLPSTYNLPKDDSLLFAGNYRNKLVVNEVKNQKVRYPVALLTLDKEYSLIVTKLDLVSNASLSNVIDVQNESADRSTMVPYNIVDNNAFKFGYSIEEIVKPVKQVYLTLYGDSIENTLRNDTAVAYNLKCKNLSIRYGNDGPIDLYIKSNKSEIPLSILFYRKNGSLYVLLLSPNKSRSLDPQLLPSLVSGS